MSDAFQVMGNNPNALFSLKMHRGEGMVLLAMNWLKSSPPLDFVGFAIQYREPGGNRYYGLKNRLSFRDNQGSLNPNKLSTMLSPLQVFRWVHFPRNAELQGAFSYLVSPVFMNEAGELSYGETQSADIELRRETYPDQLNVAFTRGFVSSQAFVNNFKSAGPISTLLPSKAAEGLTFKATHPQAKEALAWMGFEAREALLDVLDQAVSDENAKVSVVAYDLSEPEVVTRLVALGKRLRIIIDDSADHGKVGSGESQAAELLSHSAGHENVKRQHMLSLQHNKTIVVNSPNCKAVVCGSTNFSWRGLYIQANNAIVIKGAGPVDAFEMAFEEYWKSTAQTFKLSQATAWTDLNLAGIDAKVAFSPHGEDNALLSVIGADIKDGTTSSLFYSLAFLFQTEGPVLEAIKKVTSNNEIFVYGVSDKDVGGLEVQKPDGNLAPVSPHALNKNIPEPFQSESAGGGGIRMHHKFVVIDFDKPTARVYMGSYNFSLPADTQNGENLLVIRDRRIAVSYMVEALRIFDHYRFRMVQEDATTAQTELALLKPPVKADDHPWWYRYYNDIRKIKDRELFA